MEDLIQNRNQEPTLNQIIDNMTEYTKSNFESLISFLDEVYNASPFITYSSCSAMPGWNIKYKKSSKSFCTIYPDKEYFTVLIVLNQEGIDKVIEIKNEYTNYFIDLIDKSGALNGSKWLMICVDDNEILEDVKRTLNIKYPVKVTKGK